MQKPLIQRIQKSNQVAGAANHQEASPRRIQHYQRREGNAEQRHYGVSARAVQGRRRKKG